LNKKENSLPNKPKTPKWALSPFEESLESLEVLIQLVHLSMRGIAGLRGMPKLIEALADLKEGEKKDKEAQRIENAKKEAALAESEVKKGFPLLHAQAAVSLWGLIENCIINFVAHFIINRPETLKIEAFAKIKIKIGEYEVLDKNEKAYYIIELLEREIGGSFKKGTTRFEILMGHIGITVRIEDAIKRDLLELQQIRNVVTHKNSVIDRRFNESCPWLGLKVGDKIIITHADFIRYVKATDMYMANLVKVVSASLI
jgi:hypothetical protein